MARGSHEAHQKRGGPPVRESAGRTAMVYKPTLEDMYTAMDEALAAVGGSAKLEGEQRDLFDAAIDAILKAKFAEGQTHQEKFVDEADKAVTRFLGAMPPAPDEEMDSDALPSRSSVIDKLTSSCEVAIIRAADALDRAGRRELANELDALLRGSK
jgi:hypothetical protein